MVAAGDLLQKGENQKKTEQNEKIGLTQAIFCFCTAPVDPLPQRKDKNMKDYGIKVPYYAKLALAFKHE